MSDSHRSNFLANIISLALYICIFFYIGWTHKEFKTEQRVSEHYARLNAGIGLEHITLLCGKLPSSMIAECAIKQQQEDDRWNSERRALNAQEDMAFWAFWMFVVSALALLAIVGTLLQTRRAANYTEGMLSAARQSNTAMVASIDATFIAAKKSSQAFIIIKKAEGCFLHTPLDFMGFSGETRIAATQKCVHLYISLTLANIGNGPSRSVRVSSVKGEVNAMFKGYDTGRWPGAFFRKIEIPDHSVGIGSDKSEVVRLRIPLDDPVSNPYNAPLDRIFSYALLNSREGATVIGPVESFDVSQANWLRMRAFPDDECRFGASVRVAFDNFFDEEAEFSASTLIFDRRTIIPDEPFDIEVRPFERLD